MKSQDEAKCEMIVVIDNFMTSSAKYADILLPDLMTVEQEDIIPTITPAIWDITPIYPTGDDASSARAFIYWVPANRRRLRRRCVSAAYRRSYPAQWPQLFVRQNAGKRSGMPMYDELKNGHL